MTGNEDVREIVDRKLRDIWLQSREIIEGRLAILGEAVQMLERGELTAAKRAEAMTAAHKLTGSLGMFGHRKASSIAGEIEARLEQDASVKDSDIPGLVKSLERALAGAFEE